MSGDDERLIGPAYVINDNRAINWTSSDVRTKSRLYSTFDDRAFHAISNYNLSFQSHSFGISVDTFNSIDGLKEFYHDLAHDYSEKDG